MTRREQHLYDHLRHHNAKKGLLRHFAPDREDGRTLTEALERTSSDRLNRFLAMALANEKTVP